MAAGDSILIIDDEEQIQVVLKEILKLENYHVTAAFTGRQAREILAKKNNIRLILLDLSLPDCSGIDLAPQLSRETQNRIPIIFISGIPELQEMNLPKGVVGAIGKPFDLVELLHTIRRWIGHETLTSNAES